MQLRHPHTVELSPEEAPFSLSAGSGTWAGPAVHLLLSGGASALQGRGIARADFISGCHENPRAGRSMAPAEAAH